MAHKDPQRCRQTRKTIMDAFWRLYARNRATGSGPRAVTASAVIAEAGVHRSTFYKYFRDVADVLDAIESELIGVIKQSAVKAMESKGALDAAQLIRTVYVAHSERLSLLLGSQGDPGFASKVKQAVKPAVEQVAGIGENPFGPYVLEFLSSGLLSAITLWYENGCDLTADELGGAMQTLVVEGISTLQPAEAARP